MILSFSLLLVALPLLAQQYTISTYAGAPLTTPVLAAQSPIGYPNSIAVDNLGNIYFSSGGSTVNCVFKIDPAGLLTRVAGSGLIGYSGDGGPATRAQLNNPQGLAIDPTGNLYIADSGNSRLRMVSPDGVISTIAGNGRIGYSGDGGPALSANLNNPVALALAASGNLYFSDTGSNVIRIITPGGIISTVAGNGNFGLSGDGGPATKASLAAPFAIAVDGDGNLYMTDLRNNRVRKVSTDGLISTIAGGGANYSSRDGGPAIDAGLNGPAGIVVDPSGVVYIADYYVIWAVTRDGLIHALFSGAFNPFLGLAAAAMDNNRNIFVVDWIDSRILEFSAGGEISAIAGNGTQLWLGDGGPAAQAQLGRPQQLTFDSMGNLYVADDGALFFHRISPDGIITSTPTISGASLGIAVDSAGNIYYSATNKVVRISTNGITTFVAGGGTGRGDGGPAFQAQLKAASGLAFDAAGNLYIADSADNTVRKVDPSGIITTFAGNGKSGHSGDGGLATAASLSAPITVATDLAGNVYITEFGVVRKVTPDGMISTFAADSAMFATGVAVDSTGNIYIADGKARVRKVTPDGVNTIIAGSGVKGYSGDGGPALDAQFWAPYGIAIDSAGNLFVADAIEGAVRVLRPTPDAEAKGSLR